MTRRKRGEELGEGEIKMKEVGRRRKEKKGKG